MSAEGTQAQVRRQKHGIEARTVNVTLPLADYRRLVMLRDAHGTSISSMVASAVRLYLALREHPAEADTLDEVAS